MPKSGKTRVVVLKNPSPLDESLSPEERGFVIRVSKSNCKVTLQDNKYRVEHFKNRVAELGKTPEEVVIVIINVDDFHGGPIADVLMPGTNWQQIRDQGKIPFARGIVEREGMLEILEHFDQTAAEKLRTMKGLAVIVVDHEVAEVFPA
jgi:hypothetical protein